MTTTATTVDTHLALRDFDGAVAEHARLTDLSSKLATECIEAKATAGRAAAAADAAKADIRLAPVLGRPAAEKESTRASKMADQAQALVEEIEGAQRALPAKLRDMDASILAAVEATGPAISAIYGEAVQDCVTELAKGLRALQPTLLKLHALSAAGVGGVRRHLEGFKLYYPAAAGDVMLTYATLSIGAEVTNLRTAWTDDADARALHDRIMPVSRASATMDQHRARILRQQTADRMAGDELRRSEHRPPAPTLGNEPETLVPPPPRTFISKSYSIRQPGEPASMAVSQIGDGRNSSSARAGVLPADPDVGDL